MAKMIGADPTILQLKGHTNRIVDMHEESVEALLSMQKRRHDQQLKALQDDRSVHANFEDSLHSHYGKLFLKNCKSRGVDPCVSAPEVEVCVKIISISSVLPLAHQFTAEFTYILDWKDPSVAHELAKVINQGFNASDHFVPKVDIDNAGSGMEIIGQTSPEVEDSGLGRISIMKKMLGPMKTRFDLKLFPFDWQVLEIRFIAERVKFFLEHRNKSAGEAQSAVVVLQNPQTHRLHGHKIYANADWLSEWDMVKFDAAPCGEHQQLYRVQVMIVRDYRAEFWGMLFPQTSLFVLSLTNFACDPTDLGTRLQLLLANVFTFIAFKLFLAAEIPKVPYLTLMDTIIVCALFTLIAQGLGFVYVAKMDTFEDWSKADVIKLDKSIFYSNLAWIAAIHLWVARHLFNNSEAVLRQNMKCNISQIEKSYQNPLSKDLINTNDFEVYASPAMVRKY